MPRTSASQKLAVEIVKTITPLFENLTGQMSNLEDRMSNRMSGRMGLAFAAFNEKMNARFAAQDEKMDGGFAALDEKIDRTTGHLEILMERMNGKIDLALDVAKLVTHHEISFTDHERRIKNLETTVSVIQTSSRRSKD